MKLICTKLAVLLISVLTAGALYSQQNVVLGGPNDEFYDLMADAEKELLPEGYEWILIPQEATGGVFIKTAVPSNILDSRGGTFTPEYAGSTKTLFSSIKFFSLDRNGTIEFPKENFVVTGGIEIAPPRKCYLDYNEMINDKSIQMMSLEQSSQQKHFLYMPKKGELVSEGNIYVKIENIHCAKYGQNPWIDLRMYNKKVYCKFEEFPFTCLKADELTFIKDYVPYCSNYLTSKHENKARRTLFEETLPDGIYNSASEMDNVFKNQIHSDLDNLLEFENSNKAMDDLYNRVYVNALAQSVISSIAMFESFTDYDRCSNRKQKLLNYLKITSPSINDLNSEVSKVVNGAIDLYIEKIPCTQVTWFFNEAAMELNSQEFNKVIIKVNHFCQAAQGRYLKAGQLYDDKTTEQRRILRRDNPRAAGVYSDNNVPSEVKDAAEKRKKISYEASLKASQYVYQQLVKTKYFNLMFSDTFASDVGRFDINECISGSSLFEMQPIPSDKTERKELLLKATMELQKHASDSVKELVDNKNSLIEAMEEKERFDKKKETLVEYLLKYTLGFKQSPSVQPPSSREYLLTTKLIEEVLIQDENDELRNQIIQIAAGVLAVAGGILALTGIGAPAGSVLAALSAAVNSWAVFTVSTAIIVTNAGINYSQAVTEAEFAQIGGITENKDAVASYEAYNKAKEEQSSAITEAVTSTAFLALPFGLQVAVKNFLPMVKEYTFITKALSDPSKAEAYATFMAELNAAGITSKTKGFDQMMKSMEKLHTTKGPIGIKNSEKLNAYISAKEELASILKNNGVKNSTLKSRNLMDPMLDKGVLGDDIIYGIDDRWYINIDGKFYRYSGGKPDMRTAYSYNDKTNSFQAYEEMMTEARSSAGWPVKTESKKVEAFSEFKETPATTKQTTTPSIEENLPKKTTEQASTKPKVIKEEPVLALQTEKNVFKTPDMDDAKYWSGQKELKYFEYKKSHDRDSFDELMQKFSDEFGGSVTTLQSKGKTYNSAYEWLIDNDVKMVRYYVTPDQNIYISFSNRQHQDFLNWLSKVKIDAVDDAGRTVEKLGYVDYGNIEFTAGKISRVSTRIPGVKFNTELYLNDYLANMNKAIKPTVFTADNPKYWKSGYEPQTRKPHYNMSDLPYDTDFHGIHKNWGIQEMNSQKIDELIEMSAQGKVENPKYFISADEGNPVTWANDGQPHGLRTNEKWWYGYGTISFKKDGDLIVMTVNEMSENQSIFKAKEFFKDRIKSIYKAEGKTPPKFKDDSPPPMDKYNSGGGVFLR